MSFAEHNLNDNASPSPLLESTSLPLPTLPSLTPVPLPVSKRFNLKLSYANQKKPPSPFAIVDSIDSVENLHDLSKHLKEKDDIDLFTFNQSLNNFTSYISTDNTTIYNQIKRQIAQSRTILAQISENYESLYQKLSTFHSIKRKFKLPNCFKPFGIFYDNPYHTKENKDRAVIGILLNLNEKDELYKEYNDKDFREYMKDNKYKNSKVEKTKCLLCCYDSLFSVMNSFVFIAKIYIKMVNLKFFTRLYNPRWRESQIKVARKKYKKKCGVFEIYDHKKMKFFIPLENEDNIYFYSLPTN